MKLIKPYDTTVSEILTNKRYKIPSFQRDFSWDKKYYKEFLYDMIKQLKVDKEISSADYFLGTMLFLKDDESVELKVLDGQQRLTTTTILFSAISSLLKEKGENELAEATFKYIVFKDRLAKEQKVIYPPNSFPFFTKVIQKIDPDNNVTPKTDEEDLIKETYDYFKSVLSEDKITKTIKSAYLDKADPTIIDVSKYGYVSVLIALRDQVLDSQLIYIETESSDQANMIFEILNAKGKKLSPIDLIKNKIFENVGHTVDEEAEIQWKTIQRKLQQSEIPMLVFFRHFWASKYTKSTANSLYNNVNKIISRGNKETQKKNTRELLNELNRNVDFYTYIDSPDDLGFWSNQRAYQEIIDSLLFIKSFNVTQYRIAVLALIRSKKEEKINMKWFIKSIVCIEEFSFIFFQLFSSRASIVESLFSKFSISLTKCKKEEAVSIIENDLIKVLSTFMPSYEEFKVKFQELKYTNSLDKDLTDYISVRYVINKINVYYNDNSKFVDRACSIEHIIPDDKNDEVTWNIGNLISLEEIINGDLGNIEYDRKKSGYLKSNYKEVGEFVRENSIWEKTQIIGRAENLAELFYRNILHKELRKV
jgi:uncharacterized protein with ParB-like and HNH nuclease domain